MPEKTSATLASAPSVYGKMVEGKDAPKTVVLHLDPESKQYVRRPSKHLQGTICGVECNWAPSHTNVCQSLFRYTFWIVCMGGSLAGPIYMIARSQQQVNVCKDVMGQAQFDCLLEDGVAAQYAFWFTLLFVVAWIWTRAVILHCNPEGLGIMGGDLVSCINDQYGVNRDPLQCDDCAPNYSMCHRIWQIVLLVLFFSVLYVLIFCGVCVQANCDNNEECESFVYTPAHKGLVAGIVLASLVGGIFGSVLLCIGTSPKTVK